MEDEAKYHEIVIQFLLLSDGMNSAKPREHYHHEYNELNGAFFNPIAEEFQDESSATHEIIKWGWNGGVWKITSQLQEKLPNSW